MEKHIFEAKYRMWTVHRDYPLALEDTGHEQLTRDKPHIAIEYILASL